MKERRRDLLGEGWLCVFDCVVIAQEDGQWRCTSPTKSLNDGKDKSIGRVDESISSRCSEFPSENFYAFFSRSVTVVLDNFESQGKATFSLPSTRTQLATEEKRRNEKKDRRQCLNTCRKVKHRIQSSLRSRHNHHRCKEFSSGRVNRSRRFARFFEKRSAEQSICNRFLLTGGMLSVPFLQPFG